MKQDFFCACTQGTLFEQWLQVMLCISVRSCFEKFIQLFFISLAANSVGCRLQSPPKHRSSEASHMQKQSKVTVLCCTRSEYWDAIRYDEYFGSKVTSWNERSKMWKWKSTKLNTEGKDSQWVVEKKKKNKKLQYKYTLWQ